MKYIKLIFKTSSIWLGFANLFVANDVASWSMLAVQYIALAYVIADGGFTKGAIWKPLI